MDSYAVLGISLLLLLVVYPAIGGIGEFLVRRAQRREAQRVEAETIRGIREYRERSGPPTST